MDLTGRSKWGSSEIDFVFVLSVLVFAPDLPVGIERGCRSGTSDHLATS